MAQIIERRSEAEEICKMGEMSCRAEEKRKYWTEFESTTHRFFKPMVADFRTQMRVPRKFITNFREELPESIGLRGPSESIWGVKTTKANEDVILSSTGWEDFVKDHQISDGDFLVFHYAGNSTFNVTIFDLSCCEREGSYFVKKHADSCSNGTCVLSSNMDGEQPEEESADEMQNHVDDFGSYNKYFISNRRSVTEEEKKKARLLADQHLSATPSFPVVMKATCVSKYFTMFIPKNWASSHIRKGIRRAELRVATKEGKWTVGLRRTKLVCSMMKGWHQFVWDNNLEQDDACVFQLLNQKENTIQFDVIIYRVVDEIVPLTRCLKH